MPRRIRFDASAGDIANAPRHTMVVLVDDDMTDEQLQSEAELFMHEMVAPEYGWEVLGSDDDEEPEDDWTDAAAEARKKR